MHFDCLSQIVEIYESKKYSISMCMMFVKKDLFVTAGSCTLEIESVMAQWYSFRFEVKWSLAIWHFFLQTAEFTGTILRIYPIIYLYKSHRVLYRIEWENYIKIDSQHISSSSDTMIFLGVDYSISIYSIVYF